MTIKKPHLDWKSALTKLEGAYAPSTLKAYYNDLRAFVDWAENNDRPPFPAGADAICQFIEFQAPHRAVSTIQRRLYALRKVHNLLGLNDCLNSPEISLAFRRVARRNLVRPKQAAPLTKAQLQDFIEAQPDTPWGLRSRAMLSLGYELLTRRSELVAIQTLDLNRQPNGTLRVLVKKSKADPLGAGRLGFTSRETTRMVDEWLAWRGPRIESLFCPIYKGVPINRSISTTSVKRLIKTAAKQSGLSGEAAAQFSAHSLRVGAAHELLNRGFDAAAIMRAGGWKSINTLSRYLETAEHNVWE